VVIPLRLPTPLLFGPPGTAVSFVEVFDFLSSPYPKPAPRVVSLPGCPFDDGLLEGVTPSVSASLLAISVLLSSVCS